MTDKIHYGLIAIIKAMDFAFRTVIPTELNVNFPQRHKLLTHKSHLTHMLITSQAVPFSVATLIPKKWMWTKCVISVQTLLASGTAS
jgi:hypothetical protein